jgi:hypothetical protein
MLSTILADLPNLNQKELDVVQAALARLGRKEAEVPQLYTALTLVLGSKIPYGRFQHTDTYRTWKLNLPLVAAFVAETWPELQDVGRLGLLRYLLGLLAEDLRVRGIPVMTGTMVRELPNLPSLFDRCFPGYREAGLSHLIVKLMVKSHD